MPENKRKPLKALAISAVWFIIFYSVPHNLHVYTGITMNNPIAQAIDLLPGDTGNLMFSLLTQRLLGKFAQLHQIKNGCLLRFQGWGKYHDGCTDRRASEENLIR